MVRTAAFTFIRTVGCPALEAVCGCMGHHTIRDCSDMRTTALHLEQESQGYTYLSKANEKINTLWIRYVVIVLLVSAVGFVFWRK